MKDSRQHIGQIQESLCKNIKNNPVLYLLQVKKKHIFVKI